MSEQDFDISRRQIALFGDLLTSVQVRLSPPNLHHRIEKHAKGVWLGQKGLIVAFSTSNVGQPIWLRSMCFKIIHVGREWSLDYMVFV